MQTINEKYEQGKQYYLKGRIDVLKMIIEQLEKHKGKLSAIELLDILKRQLKNES
jgi:hypothetical protein